VIPHHASSTSSNNHLVGYDANDLDLDLFTSKIIHKDITELKKTHCFNTYHSHQSSRRKIKSISDVVAKFESEKKERRERVAEVNLDGDDMFGLRG
jgi:hypothetical protein